MRRQVESGTFGWTSTRATYYYMLFHASLPERQAYWGTAAGTPGTAGN